MTTSHWLKIINSSNISISLPLPHFIKARHGRMGDRRSLKSIVNYMSTLGHNQVSIIKQPTQNYGDVFYTVSVKFILTSTVDPKLKLSHFLWKILFIFFEAYDQSGIFLSKWKPRVDGFPIPVFSDSLDYQCLDTHLILIFFV